MKRTLWDKRIPTLLGLLVIVLAIGATTVLTQQSPQFFTRAGPTSAPQNIKVTNVKESSFTLAWTTEKESLGSIKQSDEKGVNEKTILDDREGVDGKTTARKTHSSTVTNLLPNTTYLYQILSGSKTYDNNGAPFSLKTAPTIEKEERTEASISGSISLPNGGPAEAIVFLQFKDAQSQSTTTDGSGKYFFSLLLLRTIDLGEYIDVKDDDIAELTFIGADLTSSKVKTFFKNSMSIPSIVLGKNYDFTVSLPSGSPEASASSSFSKPKPEQQAANDPSVLSPKKNETFTDQTPIFKGTAPKGAKINITIESEHVIEEIITANANGTWTYQPETPLTPGSHTITIRVPDADGITRILTQTFTILPSGSSVVEAATPSATPTLQASSSITISPTITPASVPPTPTFIPAISPTSAPSPIPVSGATFPSIFFGIAGLTFTLLGSSLLLFKR